MEELVAKNAALLRQNCISICLNQRQICDLELLLSGAFAPLKTFLGQDDYESVLESMRLRNGKIWPIPVCLDIDEEIAQNLQKGQTLLLLHPEGHILASLIVSETWLFSKEKEAHFVYATKSRYHWGVCQILDETKPYYVSGELKAYESIHHYDFQSYRLSPQETKAAFEANGWERVVAFQTRNPMHRAHFEMTKQAIEKLDAALLIHPSVGQTKSGDIAHFTRVLCYEKLLDKYPKNRAMLSLLPLAMRMAGPREALWHAIIRKNYGCTHFIVGRDHAGPGADSNGQPFYGHYAAQKLLAQYSDEIGIELVKFSMLQYVKNKDRYCEEILADDEVLQISGSQLRKMLAQGEEIPEWFSFKEVTNILKKQYPPKHEKGLVIFFTGLSASGKSSLAQALQAKIIEKTPRTVSIIDGDIIRKELCPDLGFSKEDRGKNVRRVGLLAAEIAKHRGVAICALIAPYDRDRKAVRQRVEKDSSFFLIHMASPLELCEQRDPKGLYAKAREGLVKGFTGIDDPYEEPIDAELVVGKEGGSIEELLNQCMEELKRCGFLET